MSLSMSKCWYSNNCLHFLKRTGPFSKYLHKYYLSFNSSCWPSADAKPMPNDLEHAMPCQTHVCSLYAYTTISMNIPWMSLNLHPCIVACSLSLCTSIHIHRSIHISISMQIWITPAKKLKNYNYVVLCSVFSLTLGRFTLVTSVIGL